VARSVWLCYAPGATRCRFLLPHLDAHDSLLHHHERCRLEVPLLVCNIHKLSHPYLIPLNVFSRRYNAYSLIAGRALARSLNENARVVAEKRGLTSLKYQTWEGGKASESVSTCFDILFEMDRLLRGWCGSNGSTRLKTLALYLNLQRSERDRRNWRKRGLKWRCANCVDPSIGR
jgi:F-type H+-transporting ATPase subunit epsilon